MKTVSHAYITGIKEGRELLKQNPNYNCDDIQAIIENTNDTLKGFTGDVADMLRGERDFWKHQLKTKGV